VTPNIKQVTPEADPKQWGTEVKKK
jgi:hypothetical protein